MQVTNVLTEGGFIMYGIVLISMLAHGAGIGSVLIAFLSRYRSLAMILGGLALGLGVLTVLIGGLGFWWGFTTAEEAVQFADPAFKAELLAEGYRQAMTSLVAGAIGALIPLLLGAIALLRAWYRPRSPVESPS